MEAQWVNSNVPLFLLPFFKWSANTGANIRLIFPLFHFFRSWACLPGVRSAHWMNSWGMVYKVLLHTRCGVNHYGDGLDIH